MVPRLNQAALCGEADFPFLLMPDLLVRLPLIKYIIVSKPLDAEKCPNPGLARSKDFRYSGNAT